MNIAKRILSFKSVSLRPQLACEITPAGIVAARPGDGDAEVFSAFAPLRPGAFTPGLKVPLFNDRAAVSAAIRQAVGEVELRDSKITVVVPDASVRVLLLDFDSLPSKTADVPPIVRFRLRKLVPFEVEDAAVSYQAMPSRDGLSRLLVAVCPAPVVAEYESTVRAAGYDPGVVLPSTLAALAILRHDEPSLVVNRNGNTLTTAIVRQNELLLHRTLELPGLELPSLELPSLELAQSELNRSRREDKEWLPAQDGGDAARELQKSVSVAIAYFEDTLSTPPGELLCCGYGGAEELMRLLGEPHIPARDLAPTPATGHTTFMPNGVLAGVLGALAS